MNTTRTAGKTRTERRSRASSSRQRAVVGILLGVGAVAIAVGLAFGMRSVDTPPSGVASPASQVAETAPTAVTVSSTEPTPARSAPGRVEVPDIIGKSPSEATTVLSAAGLVIEVRQTSVRDPSGAVISQEPAAGTVVAVGSSVAISVPAQPVPDAPAATVTVCIDPGHQGQSDLNPEPIGPGSGITKERVRGGTTGVSTKLPEFEVVLQVSMNLKARLEKSGIRVVMTRTTNDVNISNAERAAIANEAGAALFVRVHADGSTDSSASGLSTLYPASNAWTAPIAGRSRVAAVAVQSALVASTGALSRGTVARDDLTGFNWCTVPAILVECGYMSNPVEDRLLASPHYQDKLAEGMKNGILAYLEGR